MVDAPMHHCQCERWSGNPCPWIGPRSETVIVEYISAWLLDRCGNSGTWRDSAYTRLRVSARCAATMLEYAPKSVRVAKGDAP